MRCPKRIFKTSRSFANPWQTTSYRSSTPEQYKVHRPIYVRPLLMTSKVALSLRSRVASRPLSRCIHGWPVQNSLYQIHKTFLHSSCRQPLGCSRAMVSAPCSFHLQFDALNQNPLLQTPTSSFSGPSVSPAKVPPGWHTLSRSELEFFAEAFPGVEYKLPSPMRPVMYRDGHQDMLVLCGQDTYYVWNEISNDISRIEEPKDLETILKALGGDMYSRCKFALLELPGSREAREAQEAYGHLTTQQ